MKNKKQVGKALGKVASGLYVLTTKYENKEDAVLASWVNQCSFEPPAVTIALATLRSARLLVEASEAFIVNVLPKEDMALLKHFSRPPEEVFKGVKTRKGFNGINYTGSLNIIRISPDHGVAENITGKKIANPTSLINSIKFFNHI